MIKRLIRYLFMKYCEPDLIAITREQLKGVDVEFEQEEINNLSREVFVEADIILKSEAFKFVVKSVKAKQRQMIAEQAGDMTQVFFGRATINGVCLMQDKMESLASRLEEEEVMTEEERHEIL